MALKDRLNDRPVRIAGSPCSVGALLDTLTGDDLKALKTMLGTNRNPGWSASEIYDTLTEEGYYVGRQSINRHRANRCRCGRDAA